MPKVSPLKNDFSGGELGDFVHGRVDSNRYASGVALSQNWVPTLQGPIFNRSGSRFVARVKDSTVPVRVLRFEFSTLQAYAIVLDPTCARFCRNEALITFAGKVITAATQANPVQITSTAHGFVNGDRVQVQNVNGMTQLNNREFRVTGVTTNTFQIQDGQTGVGVDGTLFGAYTSGGTAAKIVEIVTPYAAADLFNIRYIQSNDVVYLVHPNYEPRKLIRTSDTAWVLQTIDFIDGPYLDLNNTATTITTTAGAVGATITLTASAAIFATTDVGRLVRLQLGTVIGYVKISAFTSTTKMSAVVRTALGTPGATVNWSLGIWSQTTGFPAEVSFFQGRLVFAAAPGAPNEGVASNTNDFENMAPSSSTVPAVIGDSNSIVYALDSNETNGIAWLVPQDRGLIHGTSGGEHIVKPNSVNTAITPTDIIAVPLTFFGSSNIAPARAGRSILYFQNDQRRLLEMAFFIESDSFQSSDLSALNTDATLPGVVETAYAKSPQPILWCVRTDGILAAVTFSRDVDALRVAWHRHILGGWSTLGGDPAAVESIAVIPSPDGSYDQVWMIVRRVDATGAVLRSIEFLDRFFDPTMGQHEAYFVDSGLSLDTSVNIVGATQANPIVITTATPHGFNNGDDVFVVEVTGMTKLNGHHYIAAGVTSTTLQLQDAGGPVDGTALGADGLNLYKIYGQGGRIAKRVSTVSGLAHLEGQTVAVVGDGGFQGTKVVSAGAITLDVPAAFVNVGYSYTCDLQLLPFDAGAADGTAEGKIRRIHRINFRLYRTLGLKWGRDFTKLRPLTFRKASDDVTTAPPIFTGVKSETVDMDYDRESKLCIRQDSPLPATILAIAPHMVTQDA